MSRRGGSNQIRNSPRLGRSGQTGVRGQKSRKQEHEVGEEDQVGYGHQPSRNMRRGQTGKQLQQKDPYEISESDEEEKVQVQHSTKRGRRGAALKGTASLASSRDERQRKREEREKEVDRLLIECGVGEDLDTQTLEEKEGLLAVMQQSKDNFEKEENFRHLIDAQEEVIAERKANADKEAQQGSSTSEALQAAPPIEIIMSDDSDCEKDKEMLKKSESNDLTKHSTTKDIQCKSSGDKTGELEDFERESGMANQSEQSKSLPKRVQRSLSPEFDDVIDVTIGGDSSDEDCVRTGHTKKSMSKTLKEKMHKSDNIEIKPKNIISFDSSEEELEMGEVDSVKGKVEGDGKIAVAASDSEGGSSDESLIFDKATPGTKRMSSDAMGSVHTVPDTQYEGEGEGEVGPSQKPLSDGLDDEETQDPNLMDMSSDSTDLFGSQASQQLKLKIDETPEPVQEDKSKISGRLRQDDYDDDDKTQSMGMSPVASSTQDPASCPVSPREKVEPQKPGGTAINIPSPIDGSVSPKSHVKRTLPMEQEGDSEIEADVTVPEETNTEPFYRISDEENVKDSPVIKNKRKRRKIHDSDDSSEEEDTQPARKLAKTFSESKSKIYSAVEHTVEKSGFGSQGEERPSSPVRVQSTTPSPPETPRKLENKQKLKRKLYDTTPFFAPPDKDPDVYTETIMSFFDQYRVILQAAQAGVPHRVPWGKPVQAGQHERGSLDVKMLRRGGGLIDTRIQASGLDDEEQNTNKATERKSRAKRLGAGRVITMDDFADSDDFVTLGKPPTQVGKTVETASVRSRSSTPSLVDIDIPGVSRIDRKEGRRTWKNEQPSYVDSPVDENSCDDFVPFFQKIKTIHKKNKERESSTTIASKSTSSSEKFSSGRSTDPKSVISIDEDSNETSKSEKSDSQKTEGSNKSYQEEQPGATHDTPRQPSVERNMKSSKMEEPLNLTGQSTFEDKPLYETFEMSEVEQDILESEESGELDYKSSVSTNPKEPGKDIRKKQEETVPNIEKIEKDGLSTREEIQNGKKEDESNDNRKADIEELLISNEKGEVQTKQKEKKISLQQKILIEKITRGQSEDSDSNYSDCFGEDTKGKTSSKVTSFAKEEILCASSPAHCQISGLFESLEEINVPVEILEKQSGRRRSLGMTRRARGRGAAGRGRGRGKGKGKAVLPTKEKHIYGVLSEISDELIIEPELEQVGITGDGDLDSAQKISKNSRKGSDSERVKRVLPVKKKRPASDSDESDGDESEKKHVRTQGKEGENEKDSKKEPNKAGIKRNRKTIEEIDISSDIEEQEEIPNRETLKRSRNTNVEEVEEEPKETEAKRLKRALDDDKDDNDNEDEETGSVSKKRLGEHKLSQEGESFTGSRKRITRTTFGKRGRAAGSKGGEAETLSDIPPATGDQTVPTETDAQPQPATHQESAAEEEMPCPLCGVNFPQSRIEAHANACIDQDVPQPQVSAELQPQPRKALRSLRRQQDSDDDYLELMHVYIIPKSDPGDPIKPVLQYGKQVPIRSRAAAHFDHIITGESSEEDLDLSPQLGQPPTRGQHLSSPGKRMQQERRLRDRQKRGEDIREKQENLQQPVRATRGHSSATTVENTSEAPQRRERRGRQTRGEESETQPQEKGPNLDRPPRDVDQERENESVVRGEEEVSMRGQGQGQRRKAPAAASVQTTPKVKPQKPVALAECFVCQKKVPQDSFEAHVNRCLDLQETGGAEPQDPTHQHQQEEFSEAY